MRWLGLCAVVGVLILAAPSSASAAVKAKPESYSAFLAQVSQGQVRSAVLVPKQTTARIRLKRGGRYVVKYPSAERQRLVSLLHEKKVHVSFAKPRKKKQHSSRIRRRYIALGVVGVGALATAGWVFTRRRRREP